jgi:hypothetical protein
MSGRFLQFPSVVAVLTDEELKLFAVYYLVHLRKRRDARKKILCECCPLALRAFGNRGLRRI